MASTGTADQTKPRSRRDRKSRLTDEQLQEILEQSDFFATDDEKDYSPGDYTSEDGSSYSDCDHRSESIVENVLAHLDQDNESTDSFEGNDSTMIPIHPKQRKQRQKKQPRKESTVQRDNVESSSDEGSEPSTQVSLPPLAGPSSANTTRKRVRPVKRSHSQSVQSKKRKYVKPPDKKWQDIREDCDIEPEFPEFVSSPRNAELRENYAPIDYFHQYYNEDFFELVSQNTNVHFQATFNRWLGTTVDEMRSFVGVTLLMSTLGFPRIRMYWSQSYRIPLIANTLTRNRYFQLRNCIHVVNNLDVTENQRERDKLWKIRPIIDSFRKAVLLLPRERNLSIDEQMIPFSGHVGVRQYVPRKPNPTGLKNYVLASANGTILDFEIYQGKTTNFPEETEMGNLGAGGRAVLRLVETCSPGTNIYFDRYFTSVTLLDKLKERGISGTGTTMTNRFPNVGFPTDYDMKKLGRGTIKSKIRDDKKMVLVKWMDNKAITMASTAHSVRPIDQCKRYSRPDQRYIEIPQPAVVKCYNVNMGGVDLANRMIAAYRSYHKTKKWPVRVFEHFMDSAAVNCWIQYRQDCRDLKVCKNSILDLVEFKTRIAECLIKGITTTSRNDSDHEEEECELPLRRRSAGRPGIVPLPPPEVAKSKAIHLPKAMDIPEAQRCRNPGCNKRSRVKCISCNIYLCLVKERDCFINFHK